MRFPFVRAAIAAAMIASGTARGDIAVVDVSSDQIAGHSNFDLAGYQFQTSQAIDVTELGMYVSGGQLADSHFVGLYTASGTYLTSATLAGGTAKDASGYAYATLATPYLLGAGTYFIGAYYNQNSADEMYAGNGTVTMGSGLSFVEAQVYFNLSSGFDPEHPTSQFSFSQGPPRAAYVGPNFQYTSATPEPGSLTVAVLGAGIWAAAAFFRGRHLRRSGAARAVGS